MKLHGTSKINGLNHLEIGGCDVIEIVKKYGTPLYVMDEDLIREKARRFIKSFDSVYDEVRVAYAGKAFLNLAMCKLIEEEGLYLDVVSGGELYTAIKASFPTQNILFHGNNKTEEELRMALENKVGRIVVDSFNEIYKLDALAQEYGVKADIYLRLSPGIEAHTHAYIKTGQIDSKFGFPIETGQAIEAVKAALAMDNLNLKGLHCHIGSQIQEIQPYIDAADIMLKFASKIKDRLQFEMDELDLGGGFGIYYTQGDKPMDIELLAAQIADEVNSKIKEYGLKKPCILIEPGRSIVGNSGTTLYTIGAIKDIPNVRKYVSVDGGMVDNIRPALYNARYEAAIANRMKDGKDELVTIAGKCCESGDILIRNIEIPKVKEGDILSIFSTGAYGESMSSNYNRIPRPGAIFVSGGSCFEISRRETYDEVIKNDVIPDKFIKKDGRKLCPDKCLKL